MSAWKIFRLSGRIAALLAIAALLLHVSCAYAIATFATHGTSNATHSGCHESAPSTPKAPGSEQQCCNGEHFPEALLTASSAPFAPFVAKGLVSRSVSTINMAQSSVLDLTNYRFSLRTVLRI